MVGLLISLREFLSTPSARRATGKHISVHQEAGISIHALREEGDDKTDPGVSSATKFLSTPSVRRATLRGSFLCHCAIISIHALRKEGDGIWAALLAEWAKKKPATH